MHSNTATLHRCAGCGAPNRPTGYVLCRDCWRSKVPSPLKVEFNTARQRDRKVTAARKIIQHVMDARPA